MAYTISSGITSDGITLTNDSMTVLDGGTATCTTVNTSGYLYVSSGGKVSNTIIDWGSIHISSGGAALNTTITKEGYILVEGYASSATTGEEDNGLIDVCSGGVLEDATLGGGCLFVFSGGTATNINIVDNSFLYMTVAPDTYVQGTWYGCAFEMKDAYVSGITVQQCGLYVSNGGMAEDIVNLGGKVGVGFGGTVTNTIINEGSIFIYEGGMANDIEVNGGEVDVVDGSIINNVSVNEGYLFIESGGTANGATVSSGAVFNVAGGGTASSIVIESGAHLELTVAPDTYLQGTYNGSAIEIEDGYMSSIIVQDDGWLSVLNGGRIDYVQVKDGELYICSGGTAFNIERTPCEGYVRFEEGASVSFASEYSGVYYGSSNHLLSHAATMTNKVVENGAIMEIMSGGTVSNTEIYGYVYVSNGGVINDANVSLWGYLEVSSGGIVNGVRTSNAYTMVLNGGKITGRMTLENGARVSAYSGSILNFNLTGTTAGGAALVNDLSIIQGTPTYTLTVDGTQENGDYILAGGAAGFNTSISVVNTSNEQLGTLTVGKTLTVSNTAYALSLSDGILSVSISGTTGAPAPVTSSGLVIANGSRTVYSGEIYEDTTVSSGGTMYVSSGGTAVRITENGGNVNVMAGATVSFVPHTISQLVMIEEDGYYDVSATLHSGTLAESVVIDGWNTVTVFDGGAINKTNLLDCATLIVSGGIVNNAHIGGDMNRFVVYSGGTANNVSIDGYENSLVISSGGKITGRMFFDENSVVSVFKGAILDFDLTGASAGAAALVNDISLVQGTPTYTLTVDGTQEKGTYNLAGGAAGFNSTISVVNTSDAALGILTVGKTLTVSGTDYTLNLSEDVLSVSVDGGQGSGSTVTSSGLVLFNESRTVYSGEVYEDTTVNSGGNLYVSSGGTANITTVSSSGYLFVSNGGVANSTTVNSYGQLNVSSGGVANSTTLYGGGGFKNTGKLHVSSGGTANSTTVVGGFLWVYTGAVANRTTLISSGSMCVYSDGVANGATVSSSGYLFVSNGGTATETTVNSNASMFVHGGAATETTVNSGGSVIVSSGGIANNTIFSGGTIFVSGGTANDTVFGRNGKTAPRAILFVEGGGVVNSTVVNGINLRFRDRFVTICSGGTANYTIVDSGGRLQLWYGSPLYGGSGCGVANYTTVHSGGEVEIESGTATHTTINNGGVVYVGNSGTTNDTTVNSGGVLDISLAYGGLFVSGGYANNIVVNSGGTVCVGNGGKLTGKMLFESGAVVSIEEGAILSFDLTQMEAGAAVLVNNLSLVQGTPTYTLTVDGTQENGDYFLADGASTFNGTIFVVNTDGESLGELNTGETLTVSQTAYTLSLVDSTLILSVGPTVHTDFEVSDFIVPATFTAGETASFSWNLTNNGEMPLDGVRQSLYLVNADDPNRKTLLKSVYLTDLPGFGESAAQTMDLVWNDTMGYANSLFQVVVEADGDVQPDDNTAVSTAQYHFEQKLSIEKLSDSFTENTGRIRVVARRTGSPDETLSAEIVLTDASGLVSTPQTVTFAAGESEKVFYLTVGDNAEYQGNVDIQVGLQAEGYEGYSQSVTLTDDELPSLSFAVAAEELTEGDTFTAFGKVQLDYTLNHDLRVKLAYDKTQLSGIPDYVVIKAGETEAAFALTVIDDATAEIDKTVKLTATADGVKSGTASLLIHDNDVPAIALSVNKTVVSEGDGVYALVGTITRTDNSTNYVKVKFADVDNSGLILPSTVTLGTGSQSVNFYIGIVDNALVDGDRTATVKANIYIDSCGCTVIPVSGETQVSFTILDNDGEALGLSFDKSNVAENTTGAAKLTITRNTVNGDAMTVNLSVTGSSLLDLPGTVQFEAGQNSVTIDVNTLTDGVNTGNQMAVVTASAEGYASAAGYLNVSDVDLPDFVISEVSPAETPAYAGKTTLVNLTLANSGFQAYSGKVNVKLSLSNGTELGTYKVNGPFEVGETKQVGFYVNLPEITGTQTILAEVDPDNLISELNDGNNTAFSASFEVKLDYIVTVETEPEVLYTKAPITVTGTTKRMDGTAIGNMPVEVLLKAATGEKLLKTTSDAEGNYALTVDPSDLYAGSYAVYAGNLGSYGAAQDRVEIAGMKVNQSRTAFTWDVENRSTTEGNFTVSNLSGVALSGVTIHAVNAPDNFVFVSDGPATLDANGQLTVNYSITAAGETEGNGYELTYGWQKIDFIAESDEGVTTEFSGYFYSNPQIAVLTLSETKDVRTLYSGKETFYEFQITNTGFGDTGEIHLNLPENDLIKIISNPVIENLAYGESATVTLKVNPVALGNGLSLNAPYTGSIGISAENAKGAQFAFDYTFVGDKTGNITITLTDEWTQYAADHPMLSGAKVGVYNAYTEKLVTTGYTDENGSVSFSDLAEGKYILKYSADGHNNAQEVVTVRGGETLELNTFLQVSTVKYTWDVQRVELTDTYEIVLSTEFETNVPAPVVTIDGPTVLPELAWGESTLMNFTVTNHGLIAAQDFTFDALPALENGYTWRVLNDQPADIAPNASITVSVLLERSTYTDSHGTVYVYRDGAFESSQDGKVFYRFDDNGRVSRITYEDSSTEEFQYDGTGRIQSCVNRDGEKTWYFYKDDGSRIEWQSETSSPVEISAPESIEAGETAQITVTWWNNCTDSSDFGYLMFRSDKNVSMVADNGASGSNNMFFLTSDKNSSWGDKKEYVVRITNHSDEAVSLADFTISNGFTSNLTDEAPFDITMIAGNRPESFSDEEWNAYLDSLSEYVGTSWTSYQEKLNEIMSLCELTGTNRTDAEYYNYLIQTVAYYTSQENETANGEQENASVSYLPQNTLTACNGYVDLKYYFGKGFAKWNNLNLDTIQRIDKQKKTIVLIHGLNNDYNVDWLNKIADQLYDTIDCNIITVDWDKWAKTFYAGATISVVAQGVNFLLSRLGLTPDIVIGHSFGAHIAGLINGGTHIALDLADDGGLTDLPAIFTKSYYLTDNFEAFCNQVGLIVPHDLIGFLVFSNAFAKKIGSLANTVFANERIDTLYKSSWICGTEERLGQYNYIMTKNGNALSLISKYLYDHSYATEGFLNILKAYDKNDKADKIGIWYNELCPSGNSVWDGIINGETAEFENVTTREYGNEAPDGLEMSMSPDPFVVYDKWRNSNDLVDSAGNLLLQKTNFDLSVNSSSWKDAAIKNGLFADLVLTVNQNEDIIVSPGKSFSISAELNDISNNYSYKALSPRNSLCRLSYYLSADETLDISTDIQLKNYTASGKEEWYVCRPNTNATANLETTITQQDLTEEFLSSLQKDGEYYTAYIYVFAEQFHEKDFFYELDPQDNLSGPIEIKLKHSLPVADIFCKPVSPESVYELSVEMGVYFVPGMSAPQEIDSTSLFIIPEDRESTEFCYNMDGAASFAVENKTIVQYEWWKQTEDTETQTATFTLCGSDACLSGEVCEYGSSEQYILKVTDSAGLVDYTAYDITVEETLYADAGEDFSVERLGENVSVVVNCNEPPPDPELYADFTIILDGSNSSKNSKFFIWSTEDGTSIEPDNTSSKVKVNVKVGRGETTKTYTLVTRDEKGHESEPDSITVTFLYDYDIVLVSGETCGGGGGSGTGGTDDPCPDGNCGGSWNNVCVKELAGYYVTVCNGIEIYRIPHYLSTPWCGGGGGNSSGASSFVLSYGTSSGSSTGGSHISPHTPGGGGSGGGSGGGGGGISAPSIQSNDDYCITYFVPASASATPDGGLMTYAAVLSDSADDGEPDSICAHVKVEFKQTAVMSREGFEGTLTLTNEAATEMTNITFTATVLNSAGEDVSDLFEIAYNGADGFSITQNGALEEYGLGNKGTGTFTVLYVPGRYTSTEGPEDYQFTGTISYTDSLVGDVSIDLTPITLTVNPSPSLQLHYFVERDVYADDPFTDAIEKSVPAEISVLVVNAGKGDARNFSLSGLTPEIVDNQKGLLLNYTMTEAAMNGVKNDNGIVDVNFGTVAANSSAVAQWWYETNIQGHYSDYSVNFTQMDYSYVDLYGNTRYVAAANRPDVSLIESADIHELIRSVQCGDDELPDFLVDDLADDADTPDTLYLSTGAVEDVNAVFAAVSDGTFGTNDVTITLTADFASGWNYLRILDPGNGDYELTGIIRDGEALNVRNFWQTDRYYLDELGVKYENRLHLLDHAEQAGTVEYTLTYTARDKNPLAVTSITGADAVVKSAVGSLTVTFNKAVNTSSFTWVDLDLFRQGDLAYDLITDAVTVTQINSTTFEIGNLGELTAADGYYQLIVRTDGITDTVGNAGSDGKALTWTMAAAVPAVASFGGIDDMMNSKADSFEITFTSSVNVTTLTPAVFLINGGSSDELVIMPVGESSTKFTVSGISGLLTEGSNVLEIDMTQVAGINGNTGLQTSRKEWTIDLTAPAVQEISENLGVSGTAPAELVFEATEAVTVSADALTLKKDGAAIASDSMNIAIDGKKIVVTGINILSDGAYELELALDKIADAAGNTGSGTAVKTWTIDKAAPAQLAGFSLAAFCDLGESDSDGRTSTRDLTLVGTLPEAGLRVRIYQQTGTRGRTLLRELTPDGTSLETAVKVQGGHSMLIAELTDAAGNTSETSLSVFVDELAVSAEFQEKFEEVLTESPQSITFVLSEEVVGLTAANFTLSINGENVPLDGMSIVQMDALTYVLSGITASANGAYTLSLDMTGLMKKSTGLACSGVQSTGWSIYHADPPTIVSTSINSEQMLDGLATFSIVFSAAMNCDELIKSRAIIQAVRIVEVDSNNNVVRFITLNCDDFQYIQDTNTLVWNGTPPLTEGGNYRLVLDTGMLKSDEGISLTSSNAESVHSYQVSEPSELTVQTQTDGYSVPVWYDYNGDGKLDLLVGEKATETTGRIRVLLNTGTAESPVFGDYTCLPGTDGDWTIAASNCLGVAPRFADVDGDGVDDLVYGTSDGRIEYALKSNGVFGTGVSLLADGTAIDVGDRAVFELVDWNGDGHLDIVSGAMDGKIYLFVNNGDWSFSGVQMLSIQLENGWSAPAVADLDGDCDLDIVSGDVKGNLYRFLNNGDGTFAVVDVTSGESDRSRPFICDINGDGILDIIVGYKSGRVSVLYGEKGNVVALDFHINSSPVFSGTPSAKVEDYQVTLSWEPASDDFGVSGYKVRIGDTEYQTTGATLTLTDVEVGTYSYQVGAYDEAGLEGWSSPGTFEIKDVTPPELNGLPSGTVWKNSVRFSWESASDNVAVAGYRIELNGRTYDTGLTVQFVSGLELGDYEYKVGAIDTSGLITWSEKQSFKVTELADTLDHVLTETVPTADYGPGCVASGIGMLLGYYDKYGYCGLDVSDLIPGEIELESRNSADALLNAFIATPGYTSRFIGQSESAERLYTLTEQNELNTAAWDSLADWLGTGQKWRGNEDYATAYYYGSLDDVAQSQDTYSVSGTALPVKFADFKYGLSLFVESVNYKLNGELTRTVKADTVANGAFSFADYAAEIDAGRGVLISLASPGNLGHMVIGYGYNEATGEIIFDDTTEAGRRMAWNGTYQYAGHQYHIQSVTTVVLDTAGLKIFDKTAPVITLSGDNQTPLQQATLIAEVDDGSKVFYRIDDSDEWTEYTGEITVTSNAVYYFKATDEAGNIGTAEYVFANIDKEAPTAPTASADITTTTNGNVLVSAVFSEDSVVKEYSLDGQTWLAYAEPVKFTENGTAFFRGTDAAGNVSEAASYEVGNILPPANKPDDGKNDYLYNKKLGWNDANIQVTNTITGNGEIYLDELCSINLNDWHNMFGNDGVNKDTGDVAKIDVETAAKLTFTIDSTAAGTFYVYEDGKDKKGIRKQIQVGKVSVKAGQTATLKDVCLTATGKYYVAMTAKNVNKAGTEGLYNVSITSSTFFVDADNGGNDTAAKGQVISVGRGTTAIVLDSNEMIGSTTFANFVGFGDSIDYAKLDLASSAYLSFSVKADGAAKFIIWKQDAKGKLSKVSTTTLTAKNGFAATTKAQFLDTGKYTYYVSMESTTATKGGSAYYNVELGGNALFFDSADGGLNNVLYDKKAKAFKDDANFVTTEIFSGSQVVSLDDNAIGNADYGNFVGYGDAVDYARIELTSGGSLSFDLKATGDATFSVYRKTEKKGKLTLETIQTTKLTLAKGTNVVSKTTDLLAGLEAGEYYISMTAKNTKANDKGSVFYNVTANATLSGNVSSALAMPETELASFDSLGISDALSFGQYDTDALANASSSALNGLDDKTGWTNIASLA